MALAVGGTALVAGGAAVLNQVYERDTDALMRRTRLRPLPDRRVSAGRGARVRHRARRGGSRRSWRCARTCSRRSLALATLVIYLAVYTPMKRRSAISTLVGAVPGALPPLIGWTAGARSARRRRLDAVRDRLPVADSALHGDRVDVPRRLRQRGIPDAAGDRARRARARAGRRSCTRWRWCRSAWSPALVGVAGLAYFWFALVLGVLFLVLSARFALSRSEARARALFFGSITYLPLIWAVMILDH